MQVSKGRGGKQIRREGEPETLYNQVDIEGQMGECKDILLCYSDVSKCPCQLSGHCKK